MAVSLEWRKKGPAAILHPRVKVRDWTEPYVASSSSSRRQKGSSFWAGRGGGGNPETLYHRDDALLYIAYVMLIWAAPVPADRWHCSLWP